MDRQNWFVSVTQIMINLVLQNTLSAPSGKGTLNVRQYVTKKSFRIPNPSTKHPIAMLKLDLLNIPFRNQTDAVFGSLSMENQFGEFMEQVFIR